MAKQAGDGRKNITREQQKANRTPDERAKDNVVKKHGMGGLKRIADGERIYDDEE